MSGSGRKQISKWDLREASQSPIGHGSLPLSFHDRGSDRHSSGISGTNDSKWSLMEANDMLKHYSTVPLKEPLSGGRVLEKDGKVNRDSIEFSESLTEWDGDGNYSIKMSPGLDEWRNQSRSRSPKSRWNRSLRSRSRSRSRSLARGFEQESGANDRSRSGLFAQSCKDFYAGRCRKGAHCQLAHHSNQNFEDRRYPCDDGSPDGLENRHRKDGVSKYSNNNYTMEHPFRAGRLTECCNNFLKGRCQRGASCRYVHHRTSDGFGMGSADEMIREREDDRKNRGSSFELGGWCEPRRMGDIPCKYFAVGNCRNGEDCRFSHYTRAYTSSDRRSRDDRWSKDHKSDNADQRRDSKWNYTGLVDEAKSIEEKHRKQDVSEPRVSPWSMDDGRDHNLDKKKTLGGLGSFDKAVETNAMKYFPLKTENIGSCMGVTESRGTDTWLGDMEMSPEWNYRVQSPNHVIKEEPGYVCQISQSLNLNETSLPTSNENINREVSSQIHHAATVIQPNTFEKSYVQQYPRSNEDAIIAFPYNGRNAIGNSSAHIDLNFPIGILPSLYQNGQSSSVPPISSINAVVQSQTLTSDSPRGGTNKNPQNLASFQDGKPINKPDIVDTSSSQITSEIPTMQNTVNSEQLAQLTNISSSLAQLFGNQQQLPQLYAALNPPKPTELVHSLSHFNESVAPVTAASTQPRTYIMSQKQYDPICDSIEQIKSGVTILPPSFSPNAIGQKSISDGKPEMPSTYLSLLSIANEPNGGSFRGTGSSGEDNIHGNVQLKQSEQGTTGDGKENTEMVPEESKKVEAKTKKQRDNSPVHNMDAEGGTDEGKKSKDVKGIRAFKFALVEFVKELLKSSWKEGQINKDAYKTIVKKVVDKVTGTIQGAHIPQTQEKIDQYLSFSKPKLTKLVQAYVEKHQKN